MYRLYADKARLTVRERETITSGSVNVCGVRFEFSPDWDGLVKTAVFRAGGTSVSVLLDADGQCVVPWEVLQAHGRTLFAGVCGTAGGDTVLPTVWASLGTILEGVSAGEAAREPAPGAYEQVLAALAELRDKLDATPDLPAPGPKYLTVNGLSQHSACVTTIFEGYPDPCIVDKRLRLDFWVESESGDVGLYTSVFLHAPAGTPYLCLQRFLTLDSGPYDMFDLLVEVDVLKRRMTVTLNDSCKYFRGDRIRLTIGHLPAEQAGGEMKLLSVEEG